MLFASRDEAARALAEKLGRYRDERPLILAIPRGAVPMGKVIADALGGELDVVLVRKIGAPGNAEYAIGSVDEAGNIIRTPEAAYVTDEDTFNDIARKELATIRKRRAQYTFIRPPIDPSDRVVIVVDDGSATGATMLSALSSIRKQNPRKLIAALAVAPPETVRRLEEVADEVICLHTPPSFSAVGQFFANFAQVEDVEVEKLLRHALSPRER